MKEPLAISIVNRGMAVHGNVDLDHGGSVLGLVNGNLISSKGLLHIGQGAVVKGDVTGDFVLVEGTVEGDVNAHTSLIVRGRIKGEIRYAGTIRLGTDAHLEGRISRVHRLANEPSAVIEPAIEAPSD
ncbi:bactofilin family protein [Ralstonia nicotianae]|uniref:bactofilin family protein n=1 Tax=Ralstonia pseudosolanacearum TaxID=1310165 RepID=UPI002005B199|nr:polymer-forming cytoskeletal protein [Ralstonia pseudosolanacearum]MCK4120425.1 polymer-forming cytoskeletal protein [Ralstonia pseudosolanacearum]